MSAIGAQVLSNRIAEGLNLTWRHGLGWLTATPTDDGVDLIAAVEREDEEPELTRYEIRVRELT